MRLDVLVRRLHKGFVLSVCVAAALRLEVVGINPFRETEQKARPTPWRSSSSSANPG